MPEEAGTSPTTSERNPFDDDPDCPPERHQPARGLIDQLGAAKDAVHAAISAVRNAGPHGRDDYPQGEDAIRVAINEHLARTRSLEKVEAGTRRRHPAGAAGMKNFSFKFCWQPEPGHRGKTTLISAQASDWKKALVVALRAIDLDKSISPAAELKTVSVYPQ